MNQPCGSGFATKMLTARNRKISGTRTSVSAWTNQNFQWREVMAVARGSEASSIGSKGRIEEQIALGASSGTARNRPSTIVHSIGPDAVEQPICSRRGIDEG